MPKCDGLRSFSASKERKKNISPVSMIIERNWKTFFICLIGKKAASRSEPLAPIILGIKTKNNNAIGNNIYATQKAFSVVANARKTGAKNTIAIQEESKVSSRNLDINILETDWGDTIRTLSSSSRNRADNAEITPLNRSINSIVINSISSSLDTSIPPIITPNASPNNGALLT